jgi:putative membrane protein
LVADAIATDNTTEYICLRHLSDTEPYILNTIAMKYFDSTFQINIQEAIAELENQSLAEIVVVAKPRSSQYSSTPVWWGVIFSFLAFTFMTFTHLVVDYDLFYSATVLTFFVGMILPLAIKPLLVLFLPKSKQNRQVEIMARALFQKVGMRHTQDDIGVLFYISTLEKQVFILPDRGAETEIPAEEWEKMQVKFDSIFDAENPAQQFITELRNVIPTFTSYIPPVENDINELPDHLEVYI